jgi:hypothetical protein
MPIPIDAPGIDETGLISFKAEKAMSVEIIPNTNTSAPETLAAMASIMAKTIQIKPIASNPMTCHIDPPPHVLERLFISQPENDIEKPKAPALAQGRKIPTRTRMLPMIPTAAPAPDPLLTLGTGAVCCIMG